MKSHLFSEVDLSRSEKFKKDFLVLSELAPDVIRRIPDFAVSITLAPSDRETDAAIDLAVEGLEVPRAKLQHALAVAQQFLFGFLPSGKAHKDTPADLLEDLNELFEMPEDDQRDRALSDFLAQLKDHALATVERSVLRMQYAHASLPNLKSVSFTVNFRAVFDETYKLGTDLDAYRPKCIGTIPVGVIQLRLDEGPTQDMFFQADRRAIGVLVDHLRALERQLDIAQRDLHLEELSVDDS